MKPIMDAFFVNKTAYANGIRINDIASVGVFGQDSNYPINTVLHGNLVTNAKGIPLKKPRGVYLVNDVDNQNIEIVTKGQFRDTLIKIPYSDFDLNYL